MNEKKSEEIVLRPEGFDGLDALRACLYTILLFLAMTIQTGRMSVILVAAAL